MNANYEKLMQSLGLPRAAIDYSLGRISSPSEGIKTPAEWYVFPPALIPIASEGSWPSYVGYWKHWFSARPGSYVRLLLAMGGQAIEIARTHDQFLCLAVVDAIVKRDALDSEVIGFARSLGVGNLDEINAVTLATGDSPIGLAALSQFGRDTPLASCSEAMAYDGWFPTPDVRVTRPWWESACEFELPEGLEAATETARLPEWLRPGPKQLLFERLLRAHDLRAAWLALNSRGWLLSDARRALSQLAELSGDALFMLLARTWNAVAAGDETSY